MNLLFVQNDPALVTIHFSNSSDPQTGPQRIHIWVGMPHYKDLIGLGHQFLQCLTDHPSSDASTLFHWIGTATIETGPVIFFSDHDLIATTTQCQVKVALRHVGQFDQIALTIRDPYTKRYWRILLGGIFANNV